MDFSQVKFTRFISPTTCYSGLRRLSEDGTGCLATESDSIRFSAADEQQVSGYPLPNHQSDDIPCVGHACLDNQQVCVFLQNNPPIDMSEQCSVVMNSSVATELRSTRSHRRAVSDASIASEAMSTMLFPPTTATEQEASHTSILVWKDGDSSCSTSLPCRLLAPTLSRIDEKQFLLWVGSADDSELRCFQLSNKEIRPVSLETLETVTSPIMAIDCCDDDQHSVAIGCQDGTVRLLAFSCPWDGKQISLKSITTHSVVVDGPILSLHLTNTKMLIGSMCGYVCQLCFNGEWEEPSMVVEDFLWDARYEADDAVLAVHYWKDRVVLGTYSGLMQVHVPIGKKYAAEWSCRLPYPIHAITHHANKLVVTTRQSLHVFEAKSIYSVERAKQRLQQLLDTSRLSIY